MSPLIGASHDETRGSFAGVIDDDIVDVVIVYDVRDILAVPRFSLNSLLRVSGWRAATAHSESLAIRVPCPLEVSIIFALLSHRILCELLRTTERSFLVVSITMDKVVVLFRALVLVCGLSVIGAENSSFAIAHITLSGQFALSLALRCLIFEVALRNFHVGFLRGFDFSHN